MANLTPIQEVTRPDVEDAVRRSLRAGLDLGMLQDFFASLDWSGTDRERPPIADLVGKIALLTEDYAEGNITRDQFVDSLLQTLSLNESGFER